VRCPGCGALLSSDAIYCHKCGIVLLKRRRSSRRLGIRLLAVLILVVVAAVGSLIVTSDFRTVALAPHAASVGSAVKSIHGSLHPTAGGKSGIRLPNGTFFRRSQQHGLGSLTISNERQQLDAVAILTTIDRVPVTSVYIRAQMSFKIKHVADGTYRLYFALGRNWDRRLADFSQSVSRSRFQHLIHYRTVRTGITTQFSEFHVTLYTVVGGNAPTTAVARESFPRP
jgi:predicted nucleic acid-binding Zn ribbon protein